jgi:hypothetical protein
MVRRHVLAIVMLVGLVVGVSTPAAARFPAGLGGMSTRAPLTSTSDRSHPLPVSAVPGGLTKRSASR